MDEGNENLVYPSPWDFKSSLIYRKILRHGTSGFISHPKEGVLQIFIALKNTSPWPSLNPRPLGLVASTLTTTTPRQLNSSYSTYTVLRDSQTLLLCGVCARLFKKTNLRETYHSPGRLHYRVELAHVMRCYRQLGYINLAVRGNVCSRNCCKQHILKPKRV
jgi:hypothetical protein